MKLVRQYPITAFFALAFALTWVLLPAARSSIGISLLALCGPAVAAIVITTIGGTRDRRDLTARMTQWRVPIKWYLVALLLPLPVSALASALEYLWGAHGTLRLQPVTPLGLVVFVLVAGEEIGWRGFALPRLMLRFGPLVSSAILGALWALWHVPLFYVEGMHQYGNPFLPFIGYTIALSVILTILGQHSRGSVIIATLFHGAVNTFGVVNSAATPGLRGWGNAVGYGVVAFAAAALLWTKRSPRNPLADE